MPHEASAIGPCTLGKHYDELHVLSEAQFQNRFSFTEFCLAHGLVAKKQFLEKPDEQLVTCKAAGVKTWKPPWQIHKYVQMIFSS